jgi:hypothetical protein
MIFTGITRWIRTTFHAHADASWKRVGIYDYEQCACGARRTTHAVRSLGGPSAVDWPQCYDGHGVWRDTSGWHQPPQGGWNTAGYPVAAPPPKCPPPPDPIAY